MEKSKGKETYEVAKSFRPISLSNYLLKALEKLSVWHMDEMLESNPIHRNQHGFLKNKCTETAISKVVAKIEKHLHRNEFCIGLFLDIRVQAAFDTINPKQIRDSLLKYGAHPDMVDWYYVLFAA